jgi:hypothetical protein
MAFYDVIHINLKILTFSHRTFTKLSSVNTLPGAQT